MEPNETPASASTPKRIIGAVVNGHYSENTQGNVTQNNEHPLHRQYVRDRMREDYGKDILQPYKNGQVNMEYVEAHGKEEGIKLGIQDDQQER
jgi:hypothetical protein